MRTPECAPKLRWEVKPSNWQAERQRWHEQHVEKQESPLVRSRHSSHGNVRSDKQPHVKKASISERERMRKAGDLVEPQINSFDLQPPVAHRANSTVTFSERQRRKKRAGYGFNGFFLTENECYDSLDQLFPGARADYAPPDWTASRRPPQSLFDSWNSGFRQFMEEKGWGNGKPELKSGGKSQRKNGEDGEYGEYGRFLDMEDAAEKPSVTSGVAQVPIHELESDKKHFELELEDEVGPERKKKVRRHRFRLKLGPNGRRLLSGAIAGAFSRTAVAPLETIRTHLMVGSRGHSVSEVFGWIVSNEGWQGLFRGNAINVLRVAPSKAIELFAFDKVKGFLNSIENKPGILATLPVSPIAGSCAGISSTLVMYPLELLKTRLTIQPDEYRGILHALYRIVTEEGFLELYRGLAPSIIGVIPYAGVNYFAYDSLRSMYKRLSKEERIGNIQTLLIGSLAGAIASSSTFPLEVARKQMQVGAIKGRVVYSSTLDALRGIVKERGISGLYRGLGPSCLKLVPAAGLSFMCYEALKRILLEEEEADS